MTEHPNVELTRRGYEAFAKATWPRSELIADDVTWHSNDAGPLSGTYHGRDEVFGFFGRLAEETAGTFRLDVHRRARQRRACRGAMYAVGLWGSRSRFRWPTSAISVMARSPSSGSPTDAQASIDFWSRRGPPGVRRQRSQSRLLGRNATFIS